jgi:hypothetical protein
MKIKKILEYKFEILLSFLIFFIPFSKALPNIILAVIFLLLLLDIRKIKVVELNKSFKILSLLLMFLILKSFLFGFVKEDLSYYLFFLIIIFIPLIFLRINNFEIIKKSILLAVNVSLLVSIAKIIEYYLAYKYLPFNDGWAVNQILVLERPYAGFVSLISIIISFDLFKNNQRNKELYLFSLLLSIFFLFIISARISLLSIIIIFIVYLLFYLKKNIKYKTMSILTVSVIIIFSFLLNQNLTKRFFLNKDIKTTYLIAKQSEPRVTIWGCAYQISKSDDFQYLIGIPSYKAIESKLTDCYDSSIANEQSRKWFLQTQYNTHNQFIHFFLIGGFLGFLGFLMFIIYSFFFIRYNFYGLSIIIAITLFLSVENIFQRQVGVFMFIIPYCLYFSIRTPKELRKK